MIVLIMLDSLFAGLVAGVCTVISLRALVWITGMDYVAPLRVFVLVLALFIGMTSALVNFFEGMKARANDQADDEF